MVDDYTWSASRCPLWVNSGHGRISDQCPLYPQKRTSLRAIAKWTPFAIRWDAQQRRDKPYHARRSLDG
jgi:hypothetical protein